MSGKANSVSCWLILWALLASGAQGAGILYVKRDAAGANNGTSWANAYTKLQDALAAAQAGDEVWVAAGTYKPSYKQEADKSFMMKTGVEIYGGFAGIETLRAQRNWVANETILSGDLDNPGQITENTYNVVKGATSSTLDGFTIFGGETIHIGGGMLNYNSYGRDVSPTVIHCVFKENKAWDGGGAIGGGSPTVILCTFINNATSSSVYHGGGAISCPTLPLGTRAATITSCTFIGNSAYDGGAIYCGSSAVVSGCVFINNTAKWYGGAILADSYQPYQGSANISRCVFSGNSAKYGGGLAVYKKSPSIANCVFSDNTATSGDGGGIYHAEGTSAQISHCTFRGNSAGRGGGLYVREASLPSVSSSIFWGNQAPIAPEVFTSGTATVFRYCDIRPSEWDADWLPHGVGNIQTDPIFLKAWNPAGSDGVWMTPDDGLRPKWRISPCINAGDPTLPPGVDITGHPRIGLPDIGAYEYNPAMNAAAGWAGYR